MRKLSLEKQYLSVQAFTYLFYHKLVLISLTAKKGAESEIADKISDSNIDLFESPSRFIFKSFPRKNLKKS